VRLAGVGVLRVRLQRDREALLPDEAEVGPEVDRPVLVAREVEVVERRPIADDERVRAGRHARDRVPVRIGDPDVEAVGRADEREQRLVLLAPAQGDENEREREDRRGQENGDAARRGQRGLLRRG
jgi:hypothetical protein